MDFITSDIHIGHTNIIKFCPDTRKRFLAPQGDPDYLLSVLNDPSTSLRTAQAILHNASSYMTSEIIREWNENVSPEDTVYILGDVFFMNKHDAVDVINRLNGKLILIQGNHDSKIVSYNKFRERFHQIHQYLEINLNGTKVCMMHYPIKSWNGMYRGSVHLHGHLHQHNSGMEHLWCRNIHCDNTGKLVSSLSDVVADVLQGQIIMHHPD